VTSIRTRAARLKLEPRGAPYFTPTDTPGLAIGYRRLADAPGPWIMRMSDGKGGYLPRVGIGTADDREAANGADILTYEQAVKKARERIRGPATATRPATVLEAIASYKTKLEANGGNAYNAERLETLLAEEAFAWLGSKVVADLNAGELVTFRDSLRSRGYKPVTINRMLKPLKAALNLAAKFSRGAITNAGEWAIGLEAFPDTDRPRKVEKLTEDQVKAIIKTAYELDVGFGLFVEAGAQTAARPSQLAKMIVDDLNLERRELMVPSSRKGWSRKSGALKPVPITAGLALRLRSNRGRDEPLLLRNGSVPWVPENKDYDDCFANVREALENKLPKGVTFTWLRSSAIMRWLLAGVPVAVVADRLDTGEKYVRQNYAAFIGRAEDDQMRKGMIEDDPQLKVVA